MIFVERFFCMFLCPMGAVFAILPIMPFTTYSREKAECIPGCSICTKTCPAAITLGGEHSKYGDCFQCGKCSVKCPKGNIDMKLGEFKKTELWLAILKSVALFSICYPIMNI